PTATHSTGGAGRTGGTGVPTSTGTSKQPTAAPARTAQPTATQVRPTATPKPSCPHPAVNNNPWCYTFFNTGNVITSPPSTFCSFFACIATSFKGTGYVIQCVDLKYSKSGGLTGQCSQHGGYKRTLYRP